MRTLVETAESASSLEGRPGGGFSVLRSTVGSFRSEPRVSLCRENGWPPDLPRRGGQSASKVVKHLVAEPALSTLRKPSHLKARPLSPPAVCAIDEPAGFGGLDLSQGVGSSEGLV